MNELLKISVSVVGLEAEVDKHIAKIENQIPIALNNVGSEMINDLQKHIQEDWYKEYTPQAYLRRTDNPSYGTPLGSVKNISVSVVNNKLDFTYSPTGEYKGPSGFAHERDGDELIKSIQLGSELWGDPPPRPFWNNFVEEQFNEKIMQTFVRSFNGTPYNIELEGNDLETDGNESMLEAGNIQIKF